MRHRLSAAATRDLARLFRASVINFGIAHADAYLRGLHHTFELIAERPEASPPRGQLGGMRLRRYEAHHIYYQLGTDVLIVRILHGRQDPGRHLPL